MNKAPATESTKLGRNPLFGFLRTIGLLLTGWVRFRRQDVGQELGVDDGERCRVFRHAVTQRDGPPPAPFMTTDSCTREPRSKSRIRPQLASSASKALITQWRATEPGGSGDEAESLPGQVSNRHSGCTDLNVPRATEALGILFPKGEGELVELNELKHDLLALVDEHEQGGRWLDEAMQQSWASAKGLLAIRPVPTCSAIDTEASPTTGICAEGRIGFAADVAWAD